MIPLGDQNAGMRFRPWVLYGLIIANFITWIYETTLSRIELNLFFDDWAATPVDIMNGDNLYTLYTSAFLHGSWGHILGNMLFLWLFGNNIENLMGHFSFFVFYSLCAIGGSGLHVLMNQESQITLVGASGAIAGVMGAYMVSFPRGKIKTAVFLWIIPVTFMVPAWIWIGIWIGSQLSGVLVRSMILRLPEPVSPTSPISEVSSPARCSYSSSAIKKPTKR